MFVDHALRLPYVLDFFAVSIDYGMFGNMQRTATDEFQHTGTECALTGYLMQRRCPMWNVA